jgi:hypothetical protein
MLEFTRYRTLFYVISAAMLLPGLMSFGSTGWPAAEHRFHQSRWSTCD